MKISDKLQSLKKPFYLVGRLINRSDSKTKVLRFLWNSFPWLMVALILLFIMIMGGLIKGEKNSLEEAKKAAIKKEVPPVSVITLNLVPSRLEDKINLPGQVEPYEDVQVKAEVPGQVVKVLVEEGQAVEKGQVLIQLDDRDYRSRLARIEANYRLAKLDYDRTIALANKKVTSLSNLDTIEAQLKDIEAQVREAKLALSRTGIAFDFHEMKISWVSESSQWWSSMASAVIFGLALATVLTLVVVPTLYALVYTTSLAAERGVKSVRRAYWAPFYRLTGTTPDEEESV